MCYSGINAFADSVRVGVITSTDVETRPLIDLRPEIYCYSLTSTQKVALIMAIAGAIFLAMFGVASIAGENWLALGDAYLFIGVGSSVSLILITGMAINHLSFARKVSDYLATQMDEQVWRNSANYPLHQRPFQGNFCERDGIWGIRYTSDETLQRRIIEFHRTPCDLWRKTLNVFAIIPGDVFYHLILSVFFPPSEYVCAQENF